MEWQPESKSCPMARPGPGGTAALLSHPCHTFENSPARHPRLSSGSSRSSEECSPALPAAWRMLGRKDWLHKVSCQTKCPQVFVPYRKKNGWESFRLQIRDPDLWDLFFFFSLILLNTHVCQSPSPLFLFESICVSHMVLRSQGQHRAH